MGGKVITLTGMREETRMTEMITLTYITDEMRMTGDTTGHCDNCTGQW